ncbi:hypothetical protein P43SY_004998 [Pythium insidiosum]|uniref:Ribonuclease H2 subunit B n=1 Tax=Pythium insidiosum TaxID=114742 RepID=A0AAD5QBZ7_PYTIN|nr:hypothetical protein P43SY_004998 [Pythium insidiosum]
MGRRFVAIAPTLPATTRLDRFHAEATDAPLYSIVSWVTSQASRQLALEPASLRLLEIQRIGSSADKNRSWFVGNHVQQDGSLVVLTPMDPLFVLLHAVHLQRDRFVSTYDLLTQQNNAWWLRLAPALSLQSIERLCDVQSVGDDAVDNLYVRANDKKATEWLAAKAKSLHPAHRVARVLAANANNAENAGAVDTKFVLPGQQSAKPAEPSATEDASVVAPHYLREAISLIADYTPAGLVDKLYTELDLSRAPATGSAPASASAPAEASLESIRRFDRRLNSEQTTPNNKRPASAQTSAKKKSKLDAVDRSGMKSIASFFGKK